MMALTFRYATNYSPTVSFAFGILQNTTGSTSPCKLNNNKPGGQYPASGQVSPSKPLAIKSLHKAHFRQQIWYSKSTLFKGGTITCKGCHLVRCRTNSSAINQIG